MRRNRIAYAIGTKLAIALILTLPTSLRRKAVEYRTLAALPNLEAGAPIVLLGRPIGNVIALGRRGDTTALRVRFMRGAARLPGSRSVWIRQVGLEQRSVLEMRAEARSAWARRFGGSFTLGGWLEVLPAEPLEELLAPARPYGPRSTLPDGPRVLQLIPPALTGRAPMPAVRT